MRRRSVSVGSFVWLVGVVGLAGVGMALGACRPPAPAARSAEGPRDRTAGTAEMPGEETTAGSLPARRPVCQLDETTQTLRVCHQLEPDGSCYVFGATCGTCRGPDCRYDASTHAYRRCAKPRLDGGCAAFAAPCAP